MNDMSQSDAPDVDRLVDRWGRVHRSLRLSVTDRCNIRCFYCMPNEAIPFQPREQLLTFEEITRAVRVAAGLGVEKLRLTGGEPLVRQDLSHLVEMLKGIPGIREVALTTNGILLVEHAEALMRAGLDRINISLDTLDEPTFQTITRRSGLHRVLEGIQAAREVGFQGTRLNAVAIAGMIERDAATLVRYAHEHGMAMRFIEFMPLDAQQDWTKQQVVSGERLRELLSAEFGPLEPIPRPDPAQPSRDWKSASTGGVIGFIEPVSRPFCESCNRLRLTAEGQLRNCLFSIEEWDLRALLRSEADDHAIRSLMLDCVRAKRAAHGIDTPDFQRPERAMYQIGG
ncbi:MAG: GTP 3',8-cyclase MoaA [Pirellulaceae bacterium]